MKWTEKYISKYYRSLPNWIDGTSQFHNLCREYITNNSNVLEIGAGPSNPTSNFLSRISKNVIGLDIENSVKNNEYINESYIYDGNKFPFPEKYFDVAVSNYVNEHIDNPSIHLREIYRVLKQNGMYIFRTPNLYHYVSLIGKLSPHWFHKMISNRLRNMGNNSPEPCPTYYKFNTPGICKIYLKNSGFNINKIILIEKEPSYGLSSKTLFYVFMLYERIVNSSELLSILRANILCVAGKKG